MVTETPVDGRCNYEYTPDDDYSHDEGYCEGHPMDNGRCFHHGGQKHNGGAPEGNDNAEKHGAYTDHIISDLSEREEEAFDALVAQLQADEVDGGPPQVICEQAVEAYLKYKRSSDARFLREYRQLLSEFNIVDNTDQHEVTHDTTEAYASLVGAASEVEDDSDPDHDE